MPLAWQVERARRSLEIADQQKAVTRCLWCRWKFRGTIADGKRAYAEHRKAKHRCALCGAPARGEYCHAHEFAYGGAVA